MQIKTSTFCPLIQKDCLQIGCSWFIQLRGKHPQTGADLDEWLCSIAAGPLLQMAVAQEVRRGAAETGALRNDIAEANDPKSFIRAIASARIAQKTSLAVIDGPSEMK